MSKEEILRIVVESIPEKSLTWIDVFSSLLTPAIAIIALYIAYQQHKTNQQRLRHETYERRLHVYKAVQKHLSIILRDGQSTYQECAEFYSEASEAAFLFDKTVIAKIDEIYEKSIDIVGLQEQLYPPDGTQGLPVGEERSRVAKEKGDLFKWHANQLGKSKDFFAEKLGIKST
ncbi:hypothetical protein ACOHYD_13805 [Desulfobacterota bacterium M19]